MAREHLDKSAALKKIHEVDRERHHFHKRYFAQEVEDPCHYHLVLNTGSMSTQQVAQVVVTTYHQLFGSGSN
jgi:cytidylate kinase